MDKEELRKLLKQRRNDLLPALRLKYSRIILDNLLKLPQFLAAKTVHCYLNYGSEVETVAFLRQSLQLGKKVFLPVIRGDESTPSVELKNLQTLKLLEKLNEPLTEELLKTFGLVAQDKEFNEPNTLLVVPLLGFDSQFHRLGMGKGWYDRFLARSQGFKVGLAFECQRVEKILSDPWDVKLDVVVRELGS
jgi:5-formyltetrahydrofolate cyclo-ligase